MVHMRRLEWWDEMEVSTVRTTGQLLCRFCVVRRIWLEHLGHTDTLLGCDDAAQRLTGVQWTRKR